jgi:hypothetical protein
MRTRLILVLVLIGGLLGGPTLQAATLSTDLPSPTNIGVQMQSAVSAANTQVTLTVASPGTGFRHYVAAILVSRTCTTAIAGTATLTVTTTNIPNNPVFTMGNACAVGATLNDVIFVPPYPIQTTAQATATTVVCPGTGATGICTIVVVWFPAP